MRGVIRNWLVMVIVLIISAAILIFFVIKIMQSGMDKREVCRQSVVLRSKSILGLEPGRVLPLNCQTIVYKVSTQDEEKIKKIMADALYDCWYMMGEGELDFLGEHEGGKLCVICGIVKFDERIRGKQITGFTNYLMNTKIPNKNITYIEYFIGDKKNIEMEGDDVIYTNQDYGIIFSMVEAPEVESFIKAIIAPTGPKLIPILGRFISIKLLVGSIIIGLTGPVTNLVQTYIKCGFGKGRCATLIFAPYNATSIEKNCQVILSIPPEE